MKKLLYIVLGAVLVAGMFACNDNGIYSPVKFDVKLNPTNSYLVGDTLLFDITGNANFITFWSGESTHEYRYRDRNTVAIEDVQSLKLELWASGHYGSGGGMKFYMSKTFPGLNGADTLSDRTAVRKLVADNFAGWEKVPFPDNKSDPKLELIDTVDITSYADNFVFMMWCKPIKSTTSSQRTYYLGPVIKAKFKGLPEQTIKITDLYPKNFAPQFERWNNPYESRPAATEGYVAYVANYKDPKVHIIVLGGGGIGLDKPQLENFICTKPMALNIVSPDKGTQIKGYADKLSSFGYVFKQPGQYTVTFVARTGNYLGESSTVREMTINIVEPVLP